jgi:hypothetical protein
MKGRRSRLALMGVLTLALALTVGLVSGSVADAKKKKGGKSFTVSSAAPFVVPGAPGPGSAVVKMPIGTVGGKATKGKVISGNSVSVTSLFSGTAGFADNVTAFLMGPSGRSAFLFNPVPNNQGGGNNETVSGPLTETLNSPFDICIPDTPAPPPPCVDPDAVVLPPYSGTIGNSDLIQFILSNPRGTWFLKVFNGGADPVTVNSVQVTGGLILKPPS